MFSYKILKFLCMIHAFFHYFFVLIKSKKHNFISNFFKIFLLFVWPNEMNRCTKLMPNGAWNWEKWVIINFKIPNEFKIQNKRFLIILACVKNNYPCMSNSCKLTLLFILSWNFLSPHPFLCCALSTANESWIWILHKIAQNSQVRFYKN